MFENRYRDALDWVQIAAKDIRAEWESRDAGISEKSGHQDIVTAADKKTEQYLRGQIATSYAQDGILGEEGTSETPENDCLWLIDPIDGTTNYANWGKHFSISIAFANDSHIVFGIVMDVMANQIYRAYADKGAWRDDAELSAVGCPCPLSSMILSTPVIQHTFLDAHPRRNSFIKLAREVRGVRSMGCVSLEMCQVSAGESGIFITMMASPWDYAAAQIILVESGGVVRSLDGSPLKLGHSGGVVACASDDVFHRIKPYLH